MAKDRITCHILDTAQGRPATGVRVRLELVTPSPSSFSSSAGASAITNGASTAATAAPLEAAPHSHHHGHATQVFESQTNEDGRVTVWLPYSASNASGDVPVYTLDDVLDKAEAEAAASVAGSGNSDDSAALPPPPPTTWTLRFDTDGYYGAGKAFFPEVAVTFRVAAGQHYHVPLLLNPFSYTTYRGS
ncbi:5-hydroxyisourate hydrolase [Sporothrix schenckii 1099-18]|uniref:Transthyretin/hydroxyisourate hydrolase domain-containing protein n=2 Tax=Sporothrix schenckii TaxID=29908 RepID=U7PV84_SPOS1|nr:5-hydroxyisourate hydrolase [Sporothrix schenckii 1099-18]ERS98664.1 hypothetical protein HMPREF1624_05451 [Sporothrix schenckii ATCC 58251]KJR89148.1 5-hydroxyisourate hydrolase [Sporothrix schenckii 1099-18]